MDTHSWYLMGLNENDTFISMWKTDNTSGGSSANNQVKLPLINGGTYNFVVDWGDGNSDTITAWNQSEVTHTYSTIGTYTIRIKGALLRWSFNDTGDKLKLLTIVNWGKLNIGISVGAFWGCSNLTLNNVAGKLDLTNNTVLSGLLLACSSVTTVNGIERWNVSTQISLLNFALGATNFNQNIGNWDVSSVTNMTGAFAECGLNQNLGSWNVSNVTNFTDFMRSKTPSTLSATNLDAIYNGWSSRPVKPNLTITFGTAKYTSASSAGRAILTSAPNNWTIIDGGI